MLLRSRRDCSELILRPNPVSREEHILLLLSNCPRFTTIQSVSIGGQSIPCTDWRWITSAPLMRCTRSGRQSSSASPFGSRTTSRAGTLQPSLTVSGARFVSEITHQFHQGASCLLLKLSFHVYTINISSWSKARCFPYGPTLNI